MSASADYPCTSYRASFRSLLDHRLGADAITNDVEAFAAPDFFFHLGDRVGIGDAAQRQRYRAGLARARQRLGLLGFQLEGRGPADARAGTVFFLRRLVDRENPNVGQDDFRADDIGQFVVPIFLALGKDHIDAV